MQIQKRRDMGVRETKARGCWRGARVTEREEGELEKQRSDTDAEKRTEIVRETLTW